ncbi:MAG: hypothetical protein AABY22_04605 [Nanoarchaeota archaeon]
MKKILVIFGIVFVISLSIWVISHLETYDCSVEVVDKHFIPAHYERIYSIPHEKWVNEYVRDKFILWYRDEEGKSFNRYENRDTYLQFKIGDWTAIKRIRWKRD